MSSTETQTKIAQEEKPHDVIPRGAKGASPFSTALFLGIRSSDVFFNYSLLAKGVGAAIITTLGGSVLKGASSPEQLAQVGLTPYRASFFAMTAAAALKHAWYVFFVGQEAWTPQAAFIVGGFNCFWNTTNALLLLCAQTSVANKAGVETMGTEFYVGTFLFWLGLAVETIAEIQRKQFKEDPRNKGKAYTGGLFSLARHINYSGYSLWRTGVALTTAGWGWAAFTFAFFIWDFSSRAIPAIDDYCSKRYTFMWENYKRQTPHKLIPGLF